MVEDKEEYVNKINAMHSEFSDEKERLQQEKREWEKKFATEKLDVKLKFKEEKLKQIENRMSEIRAEWDSEISRYKGQIKELNRRVVEFKEKFENQQVELDKNNSVILEKQSQIDVISEAIKIIQNQNDEEIIERFLQQNSELWWYKSINAKLEVEIQTWYKKFSENNEELNELKNKNEDLADKLEENENAYESLRKEVESLTSEFENIESEKAKALTEVSSLTKKKQDLELKLAKREDEVKLLKTQILSAKNSFNEKITDIK